MTESNDPARLEFPPDQMRALGYQVVDYIVDHFTNLPELPASRVRDRASLETALREPAPAEGRDLSQVLAQLDQDVFSNVMYCTHPRHFAWVPGPSNFVGVLADALASGINICPGTWLETSGPSQVELVTLDWLREVFGLPEGAGGLFVSGGSVANLTALAAARREKLGDDMTDAVAYCSDQTHSSVLRNLRILGFRDNQVRKIQSDDRLRLDVEALAEALARDKAAKRRPFCVIGTAGTTNTGAVDPLDQLADFCEAEDLWLHVDGAFGASAALTERGQVLLSGLGRAHSVSVDPHKWLFQPFELGCCLVRDVNWLNQTFVERPEYLQDAWSDLDVDREVNFCDRGVQLTRGFRALKLWMTIKVFGMDALRAAVDKGLSNAERVEEILRERGCFEIVTPAQLGMVSFRYSGPETAGLDPDEVSKAIFDANMAEGYSMLTTTKIRGAMVLRMCTINPRTSEQDLVGTIDRLAHFGRIAALELAAQSV